MDSRAYTFIDQRLRMVETEVTYLRGLLTQVATGPAGATATAASPAAGADATTATAGADAATVAEAGRFTSPANAATATAPSYANEPRTGFTLEAFVAGRGLQGAGLILLLVGVAFFLKLAFDDGLIGPSARVVLGIVTCAALIFFGARVRSEKYAFFADGTIALGGGIGFLSIWAAGALFHLASHEVAFGALIAVTAVVAALSVSRKSERLAIAGAIGGYFSPYLLDVDLGDRTPLFFQLFLITLGFLVVSRVARFRYLDTIAFVGVLIYSPFFHIQADATGRELAQSLGYFGAFFVEFAAALHFAAHADRALSGTRMATLVACFGAFAIALEVELADHQTLLGAALFALAAALLASVRAPRVPALVREVYGWLGLGALTLAAPALVHHQTLAQVWTIESGVVIFVGARAARGRIVVAGLFLYAIAALLTLEGTALFGEATPFLNARFLGFALLAITAGLATFAVRGSTLENREPMERSLRIATHAFALIGLTTDLYALVSRRGNNGYRAYQMIDEQAQFAISILWTFYGAALFGVGLARGVSLLRWLGLGLFAITIGKVFLIDLASIGAVLRVGSFIVLGLVLTGASALYQRATPRPDGKS